VQQNFDYEEVKVLVDTSIEPVLANNVYSPKKVHDWTSAIIEQVLTALQALNKPFKYVVTCIIMQRNGAGLHTASTCFWDSKYDGSVSVPWENSTTHAIVTVFALHI
jgi:dynein light chain Tctex-type 1